ncbi:MAG TPA: preprotein translocase subunit SecG [Devosia sp.]|nr:preprotein translocase subunit SecG [Devosia sp.]
MANVLIVAYLLIVVALVAVILLQRSEGGGLGIGGGSANAFMSVRGSANVLTRATGILAALFFLAAIGLTVLNGSDRTAQNILERATQSNGNASTSVLDALNAAQKDAQQQSGTAPAPAPATPATPAAPAAPANQDAPNVALPAPANTNSAPAATAPATTTLAAPATTAPAATPAPAAPAGTTAPPAPPKGQ